MFFRCSRAGQARAPGKLSTLAIVRFWSCTESLQSSAGDTVTIEWKISGVPGKPRYHVVNEDKLQSILVDTGAG